MKNLFVSILIVYLPVLSAGQETKPLDSSSLSAQKEIGQDEESLQESLTIRPDETEIILEPEGTQDVTATEAALDDVQLPGIGFGDILRFIAIFVILIFLAYFFLLLLRRLSGVKAGGKKLIRLISTQPLKGESALYIVEVASRFFLISSSSNSVNLITEFDDDSKKQILMDTSVEEGSEQAGPFIRTLSKKFSRWHIHKVQKMLEEEERLQKPLSPDEYLRTQRKRLHDL